MKKNRKSKIVLASVLGLAAISIGTVGFATWMVGVQKLDQGVTLNVTVDDVKNQSIFLTAEVEENTTISIAEEEPVATGKFVTITENNSNNSIKVDSTARQFTFSNLSYKVGKGVPNEKRPTKITIALDESEDKSKTNTVSSSLIKTNKGGEFREGDSWKYLTLKSEIDLDDTTYTVDSSSDSNYDIYTIKNKTFKFGWGSYFGTNKPSEYYNGLETEGYSESELLTLSEQILTEIENMNKAFSSATLDIKVSLTLPTVTA